MANTYTNALKLRMPAKGDTDWDDEINANIQILECLLEQIRDGNFVKTGCAPTDGGGVQIDYAAGTVYINGSEFAIGASNKVCTVSDLNWLYVNDAGTMTCSVTPPTGNYALIAFIDTTADDISRFADLRVLPQAVAGRITATRAVALVVFDWATNLATGDGKFYFPILDELNGMNLVRVAATVITAGTTNATTIAVYNVTDACEMLSTLMNIESGETSTRTSATPGVIDTDHDDVATGDVLRIDVDAVSTTPPKGLVVELVFRLP